MDLHRWWSTFGSVATDHDGLPPAARHLISAAAIDTSAVRFVESKVSADGVVAAIRIDVEVERPQILTHPIRATEPIAIFLTADQAHQPSILALRADFPDTPHQNGTPTEAPAALCVDDRPWSEARLTYTPADLLRRIRLWLSKAASGELHDTARPLDPMFFRTPRALVIPRNALTASSQTPIEFVGFVNSDDKRVIIALPLSELGGKVPQQGRLAVIVLRADAQPMMRMRQPPGSIAELAAVLANCGIDLVSILKTVTGAWAGLKGDDRRRLSSALAILVVFAVVAPDGNTADDLRAFVTQDTAGEVGVALGALLSNDSGVGEKTGYLKAISGSGAVQSKPLLLEPTDVHLAFDPQLGAEMAAVLADSRPVVLIGAGSIGSQVALNLVREGSSAWTVVDHDRMMPHNLARHGLSTPNVIGIPKAVALTAKIAELIGAQATPIVTDVTEPATELREQLDQALQSAELILDTSASVAAARHLSDLLHPARRASAFFNPAGSALVLLVEAADRSVTLRDLEAQYHRLIQSTPDLRSHLAVDQKGLRYSGSCRALSNRISASNAALLSALASRAIRRAIDQLEPSICVWSVSETGEVRLDSAKASTVTRVAIGGWELAYDANLLAGLALMRQQKLPRETGGVLLGIADMSRRSLHLVTAHGPPADSIGTVAGFERGTAGLFDAIKNAAETSQYQIRYVGEWHSHPPRSSPLPSPTDLHQIAWLRRELQVEGLPALMAIAADDGQVSFCLAGATGEDAA